MYLSRNSSSTNPLPAEQFNIFLTRPDIRYDEHLRPILMDTSGNPLLRIAIIPLLYEGSIDSLQFAQSLRHFPRELSPREIHGRR